MPTNYRGIESTLIESVHTLTSSIPTSYPNAKLSSRPDGLWLNVNNVRGTSDPVTLGDKGEDNHPGFLQIDVNYPMNKGTAQVLDQVDLICGFYTAGKLLQGSTPQAHKVRVLSTSASRPRIVDGYYRVSISVNYYARSVRN